MKANRIEPLTIAGPRGLDRVIEGLKLAYGASLFETKFPVIVQMIDPGDSIELGSGSTLSVTRTAHTHESLAVNIQAEGRKLCYTGDTKYDDELTRFFNNANLLISECSFREPRDGVPHLSVNEVALLASRAGVGRLIVSHFYFEVDDAELKSELEHGYNGEVIIGQDGLSVEV
jgi:ribonuclease BN (tRNA processing enzyme)